MNGATTIQERLKDLRLNKGLKLEELAEQTGISKSALGSYEKDDFKEINHGNPIHINLNVRKKLDKVLMGGKFAEQTVVNPTAFQKCHHFIAQM